MVYNVGWVAKIACIVGDTITKNQQKKQVPKKQKNQVLKKQKKWIVKNQV